MKKKITSKNNISGFAPELHWDLILVCVSILIVAIAVYFSFVYITLNRHIQNISVEASATDSGSSKDELALKKIINMESVIAGYRDKDLTYHTRLTALINKVPAPVTEATTTATSSKNNVVASSTVR